MCARARVCVCACVCVCVCAREKTIDVMYGACKHYIHSGAVGELHTEARTDDLDLARVWRLERGRGGEGGRGRAAVDVGWVTPAPCQAHVRTQKRAAAMRAWVARGVWAGMRCLESVTGNEILL